MRWWIFFIPCQQLCCSKWRVASYSATAWRTLSAAHCAARPEFRAALLSAQATANIVLGHLADTVASDPQNEDAAREHASVLQVVTCVLMHRKSGAVSLQKQMAEPAERVYQRETANNMISSYDEDDAGASPTFRSHNTLSCNSDIILNFLTCIGSHQSHHPWNAALERDQTMAPLELLDGVFGAPTYTVVLVSIDPTKAEAAATLSTQFAMTIKLHRRPLNGSASRLIQTTKYKMADSQAGLNGPNRPSSAQQRDLNVSVQKNAATLQSLGELLHSIETRDFSVSGTA
ncbi:hypothetical protein JKF63_02326 [Porcisia hertigi]|uniref:Uncharacterized protein n=1 Tax=Porcisia hertigi TaxID=2761500 RepID=A0A836I2G8_9TRYP|nr:hypothetical protein JKF63_02326 [Porcisia hertigi]